MENKFTTEERKAVFKQYMEPVWHLITPELCSYLDHAGFFEAPASTKYHYSYHGGLFDHSLNVMNSLVELTKERNLVWSRPESPYIIGMFHDLCKIDNYIYDLHSDSFQYNSTQIFGGHGDKSIILLSQFMTLTAEEILCIYYHMGAFVEKEEWSKYTAAIHCYPNVLYTHTADMIATHIMEVE